ncbi:prepilin-type N-terminal cleavage/methylation domain-containing protein [Candidatus Gracilibacteria bacterium]|nr:prepilin-type N-terminal cleavage/methylation domain-containing protein [Candidatus Gracilibacteria bacterium]
MKKYTSRLRFISASFPAFTLVELIVVVTIISILGTVGFVSYSNYLTTARDSNRISQSVRIADALQTFTTTHSLPLPDNAVTITDGAGIISYQGDLGESVLQTIDYSTTARDPRDNSPFIYAVDATRQQFQITTFMENQLSQRAGGLSQGYANLTNRFPVSYGTGLGVLLEQLSQNSIHRITSYGSSLDIESTTDTFLITLGDSIYTITPERIQNFFRYHRASVRDYVELTDEDTEVFQVYEDLIRICTSENIGQTQVYDISQISSSGSYTFIDEEGNFSSISRTQIASAGEPLSRLRIYCNDNSGLGNPATEILRKNGDIIEFESTAV